MKKLIKIKTTVGPFKRAGKWIRGHQKTIYISASTLIALIGAYQLWKLENNQMTTLRHQQQIHEFNQRLPEMKKQLEQHSEQLQIMAEPGFKEFLMKKYKKK